MSYGVSSLAAVLSDDALCAAFSTSPSPSKRLTIETFKSGYLESKLMIDGLDGAWPSNTVFCCKGKLWGVWILGGGNLVDEENLVGGGGVLDFLEVVAGSSWSGTGGGSSCWRLDWTGEFSSTSLLFLSFILFRFRGLGSYRISFVASTSILEVDSLRLSSSVMEKRTSEKHAAED